MVLNLNKLKEYNEQKFKEDLRGMENYKYITNMTNKPTENKYSVFLDKKKLPWWALEEIIEGLEDTKETTPKYFWAN